MPTCGECKFYRPVEPESKERILMTVVSSARATLDVLDNTPLVNREARLIISQYYLGTLRLGWSCISDEPTVPSFRICQVPPGNFSPRRSVL